MKKVTLGLIILGMSFITNAGSYDISSKFNINDNLTGSAKFKVDEGKSASFSKDQLYEFKVSVTKQDQNKVLLDFTFAGDEYKTESQAILDLNKEAEFIFGKQRFKFLISKSSS